VVTACATGAHAIGDAARLIAFDDADVMVAGGTESAVCRLGIAGFNACRALSTAFNDNPTKASRPYDKDRDGFVMGEGAGIVVLEEHEHAKARGAKIYGEVKGYGLSGDAYHITAPSEDGDGGFRAMTMALKRAGVAASEVDYINAHGTSTMADGIELGAVERLLGDAASKAVMSSTKSSIGHLLGAAGSVEAIFCLLAMRDGIVPPTINLDNPNVTTQIDLVPLKAQKREVNVAMSNSFGFGGTISRPRRSSISISLTSCTPTLPDTMSNRSGTVLTCTGKCSSRFSISLRSAWVAEGMARRICRTEKFSINSKSAPGLYTRIP